MKSELTPLSLTQKLLSFNTINPPGNERDCVQFCGNLLAEAGFEVSYIEFDDKRTSLLARKKGEGSKPAICFSGHLDTVPLGMAQWTKAPFQGEVNGDRVYGRGASDMKAGVAAMIFMANRFGKLTSLKADIIFILTAGEETFCEGASQITQSSNDLGEIGAIIVGEPTSNYPLIGHKGCIQFELTTKGITAHASTPTLGENAIVKAARVIDKLQKFKFPVSSHPLLGDLTLNIGTISGGMNINSVPDKTVIGIDIRTIPGIDYKFIQKFIRGIIGKEPDFNLLGELKCVLTDAEHPWVQKVFEIVKGISGKVPVPSVASYFTDASVLTPACVNPPTIILGPGEPELAHQTDEYCYISKIEEAVQIYSKITMNWCEVTF